MGALTHRIRLGWKGFCQYLAEGRIDPLPARHAISGYNLTKAGKDTKAALDVALVGLPQGMAFAAMAGLDSIYSCVFISPQDESLMMNKKFILGRFSGVLQNNFYFSGLPVAITWAILFS